ncbi:MAG: SRPBCC family protein [Flavobacteriaceae bacterium]|nr:SRPBCC family protein [Flavobacteriaceae bacterium]
MKPNTIEIKHTIFVNRTPEEVWDFTQDYSKRRQWDKNILKAEILQTKPRTIVKLKTKGNTTLTFEYKQEVRPKKASFMAKEIKSSLIFSYSGSWVYEPEGDGCNWTQTNQIVLNNSLLNRLLFSLYKTIFQSQTVTAMKLANILIKKG